ncbi:HlyD family efflux transporter periplasmic adaptor subunit [bacterium]|nr:HlyD family efflux transporter periplasmic adaptor subunit [bacterium]
MADLRFELRSESVQEILSHIPHWIIRWGITVIFLTVALLVAAAWVIKYPDLVAARVTVTTAQPPIGVLARSSGVLRFFVREDQAVSEGDYLAAIANPDSLVDIFQFKRQLEAFRTIVAAPAEADGGGNDSAAALDRLQVDYSGFLQGYFKDRYFNRANYQADRIRIVVAQIVHYKDLNRKLSRQRAILAEEAALAEKKYRGDTVLFQQHLISEDELARSRAALLQKRYAVEQARAAIIGNRIKLADYQQTALEFLNELAVWEDQYIIKSPVAGTVSFFKYWSDYQTVAAGDEVLAIVPHSTELTGRILLPQASSGKVRQGQTVRIKFDSYPFMEYGMANGTVAAISAVARDDRYLVEVAFPAGLATTYGKRIEFKQGMQGTAEIVTEDLRLLQRVFYRFKHLFHTALR